MFIPDPDFYPSIFTQKQQQKRGAKKNLLSCLFLRELLFNETDNDAKQ
jgi:hypothetical protein